MMPLNGKAFLALWNGCKPTRDDYDVWHTREHVPQRLTVPGFSRAVRYADGDGPLPKYFTLYVLDEIPVLESEPYLRLLNDPTPWSLSMRSDLTRFLRLPCTVARSTGAGSGGWCATGLIIGKPDFDVLDALVIELAGSAYITAVHLGSVVQQSSEALFHIEQDRTELPSGVLVVEGYEDARLREALTAILARYSVAAQIGDLTFYAHAFAMTENEAASIRPFA